MRKCSAAARYILQDVHICTFGPPGPFGRIHPEPGEPTDAEKAEIERLRTRHDELANMDEHEWTDEFVAEAEGTLPDDPNYAFCPSYELGDEPQQIRIVFEGMDGYVPTALVALTVDDAERLCDKLNRRLGHSREDWTALAAQSMRAEAPEPGDTTEH